MSTHSEDNIHLEMNCRSHLSPLEVEVEVLKGQIERKDRSALEQSKLLEEQHARLIATRRELELSNRRGHELGSQLSKLMLTTAKSLEEVENTQGQTARALEDLHSERITLQKKLIETARSYEAKLQEKSKQLDNLQREVEQLKAERKAKEQLLAHLSHAIEEQQQSQSHIM